MGNLGGKDNLGMVAIVAFTLCSLLCWVAPASALVLPHSVALVPSTPLRGAPIHATRTMLPTRSNNARAPSRLSQPQMGLFRLGTPELAIIACVALLVLGPE